MVDQQRIWDEDAAWRYDTPGEDMFAPDVLGPTVEALVELADGDRAVEFAVGTGRVAIPLAQAGVEVSGIGLSTAMHARLREKIGPLELPVIVGDRRPDSGTL
jgi:ubiquinone/menaquinone biosynthesis C-methylase UbiE